MNRVIIASFGVVLLATLVHGADWNARFANKFQIPGSREVVVVAEGDFEPRSIGSYALRVYGASSKKFPVDDFVVGLVRPRNGTVEEVRFHDVDGDGRAEIVVIIRSAGSGGYLSADAFRFQTKSLEFIASVSDLDRAGDPIKALCDKLTVTTRKSRSTK